MESLSQYHQTIVGEKIIVLVKYYYKAEEDKKIF